MHPAWGLDPVDGMPFDDMQVDEPFGDPWLDAGDLADSRRGRPGVLLVDRRERRHAPFRSEPPRRHADPRRPRDPRRHADPRRHPDLRRPAETENPPIDPRHWRDGGKRGPGRPVPPPRVPSDRPESRRRLEARPAVATDDRAVRAGLVKRVRFLRIVLAVVVAILVVRLVQVQVFESGHYQQVAGHELAVTVKVSALRGAIYSRDGQVLALSVPTADVYADDYLIEHPVSEARALAPLLHVPAAHLATELHQPSGYVALAKGVSHSVAQKITADTFPGISIIDDSRRIMPNGDLASPLLGLVNAAGKGAAGLEYQHNSLLAGQSGIETVLETPAGVALPQNPARQSATVPGSGLELTVDTALQYETEQALAAQIESSGAVSGTAIVMDVKSGDILSMANLAATQPNGPRTAASTSPITIGPTSTVEEASSDLALTQTYEPGSVFKLVTFSAALAKGEINPNSTFNVPDKITLDGSVFHDAETHPTEQLSATQILAQSSNIGTSEIAQALGEKALLAQVKRLGFGSMTGLDFPGESPGLLATAKQWEPTNFVSLPIGQVDAVTAQQMLDAYNTVANGGVFVAPRLVRGTVTTSGAVSAAAPSKTHRAIPASTDAQLTKMFEQVVTQGTGTGASVPGYAIAGKTGTAQVPTPGKDSYVPGDYTASFVGFAPADHPVFSAIVILNRPQPIYGGTVAAPVFSQIMSYALHHYDIPSSPGVPTSGQSGGTSTGSDQAQDIT